MGKDTDAILAFFRKILRDRTLRPRLIFIFSVASSFAFLLFYTVIAIQLHSFWYGSRAMYYTYLVVVKIILVSSGYHAYKRYTGKPKQWELAQTRIYRRCGFLLLWVELMRTASIFEVATIPNPAQKGFLLTIVTAYYTGIRIVFATSNILKAWRSPDMVLRAIRSISLMETTSSILFLMSTMVSTYGNFTEMRYLLGSYAVVVSVINCLLALWMIVSGTTAMAKSTKNSCP